MPKPPVPAAHDARAIRSKLLREPHWPMPGVLAPENATPGLGCGVFIAAYPL
ncbi:hypothetical protein [Tabrizicola sp. BL-A-41-H6]|uniref:hypothetical protein n=1 Tax=Tabrizicola sp. BL-A-41-H6 TaxID=3421107 RepID=UPI003D675FAA